MNRENTSQIITKGFSEGLSEYEIAEIIVSSRKDLIDTIAGLISKGKNINKSTDEISRQIVNLGKSSKMNINFDEDTNKKISKMASSKKCDINVLTIDQFDILIRSENISNKDQIRRYYTDIHRFYMKLCELCNNMTKDKENRFLILAMDMSGLLFHVLSTMKQSIILRDALTLMFCNKSTRCTNHSGISGDRSFLNWMSHEASHIANKHMGVTDEFINKIPGGESIDDVAVNVRKKLSPHLTTKLGEKSFCEDIIIAEKGYTIDERFRQIRNPPDDASYKAICGEVSDGGHEHRSKLASAITIVLSEWRRK